MQLFASYLSGSSINVGIAFLAGFTTFFASCLLPLVPTYLAYLSGVSLGDSQAVQKRWEIVKVATFFVVGFIVTFVALGLVLHNLAAVVAPYKETVEKVAGLFFIVMGLFMFGVFKHQLFDQERRFSAQKLFVKHRYLHALLVGVAFGFGWTPCIGPVLALILYWSAQQASMWHGTFLLIVYGLGLGTPFLLVALGFEKVVPLLKRYKKISLYVSYVSAAILILVGTLLLFGKFQELSFVLLQLFNLHAIAA